MAIQGENVDNWKVKLQEIYTERRQAIDRKRMNGEAALAWIRETLNPAFSKLEKELQNQSGVKNTSHSADGKSLDSSLKFTFVKTSLCYSINLLVSSKGVAGEISFTATSDTSIAEDITSIITWGEQEIIKMFLSVHETWEAI